MPSPKKKSSRKVLKSRFKPRPEPPESPSDRARREQDEAENKGIVSPGLTVDDDGQLVQKTPQQRKHEANQKIQDIYKDIKKGRLTTKKKR